MCVLCSLTECEMLSKTTVQVLFIPLLAELGSVSQ